MGWAAQVSCEELTEYKASVRGQLRGLLEREKDPVLGMVEWVVLYVRPLRSDVQSRCAAQLQPCLPNLPNLPPHPFSLS